MARVGYARATMPEVARTVGLSQGLLHYHFDNKLQILLAVVDHLAVSMRTRSERMLSESEPDADARLAAFVRARLGRGDGENADAVACWVALGAEAIQQPEVRLVYARAVEAELEALEGLVREALMTRNRHVEDARPIALSVYAAIQGIFQVGAACPGTVPSGSGAQMVTRLAEALLAASREPRIE
ncbi:MAG: TetR family transcriptional regulator [Deltaproteobacteria bacterium]|nr:TetR family transcriptional regulator [Deltaproteobacteria bacterium]